MHDKPRSHLFRAAISRGGELNYGQVNPDVKLHGARIIALVAARLLLRFLFKHPPEAISTSPGGCIGIRRVMSYALRGIDENRRRICVKFTTA